MKWRVYPEYKESGIEWLGKIPVHWDENPFKSLFEIIYRYPTYYDIQYVSEGISEVRGESLSSNGTIQKLEDERYISEETNSKYPRTQLKFGDIVMSVRGTMGKVGFVDQRYIGANITANLIRLAPKNDVLGEFLRWLFLGHYFNQMLDRISPQTTIKTITVPQLSQILLATPPVGEQHNIAAFLDRETDRIDTLITKKERQIELLQEKRAALRSHVVTKGLNPNDKMKDSGIEWLGEIPEHWIMTRFKYALWLQRGHDLPATDFRDGVYPVCGSNGCIGYHDHFTTKGPGVTVGRSGSVGEVNYIDRDYWAHNTALYVKEFRRIGPKYAFYLLKTLDVKYLSEGSAVGTLNRNYIHDLPVAIPTVPEQDAIVEFLDRETMQLEALIEKIKASIETLREYRTALISAAVTGKIDVWKEVP